MWTAGLVGDTDWDQARGDMLVDYVDDMGKQVVPIRNQEDPEKQAGLRILLQDFQ